MNGRVLGTELKRSAAPVAGVLVPVGALAFIYLMSGSWWQSSEGWTAQWTSMALLTRTVLYYLWPIVVGIGALQGLRDSRSRMTELLSTTPRPAWRRALLPSGATALAVASGFGLLVLWGAVQVALGDTTYTHPGWVPISLVGTLALVAGALFGMGVARALPSVLTPPALVVACLAATILLQQNADGKRPTGFVPNRLSLLSPALAEPREVLLTLSGSVHVGQTLWLLGLLATGFALLIAASHRARLLALAPVLAGAALALLVLPADARSTYVIDKDAAARVCDGKVCVTRTHRSHLPALASQGEEALRVLRDVLGDRAPAAIHEDTALRAIGDSPHRSADTLLVDFEDPLLQRATGDHLTRYLIGQGLAPSCNPRSGRESGSLEETAFQSVTVSWALGDRDLEPLEKKADDRYSRATWQRAETVWKQLAAATPADQRARIAAAHEEAVSCTYEGMDVLAEGTAR
ncbi:hypothetical protein [Streptomyces sp. 8ZJF_21]|uniref:hypothetical protein n=1 Tax=Streptomyces sp. 8ZJF_21 TaxID=2903141 RepID=UPI001E3B4B09|nr:hypothetical protein [Streptomyces sp. 8ZJF_21]MCD9586973.1 hypothetical protein [Streptomyces sp. 8ZJF_21]